MRPIPEEMRLQYKEAVRPPSAGCPHPGLPELRAGGPDVGGLDRGRADPGRLPRHRAHGATVSEGDSPSIEAEETFAAPPGDRGAVLARTCTRREARSLWQALSAADAAGMQAADRADPGQRCPGHRAVRRDYPV